VADEGGINSLVSFFVHVQRRELTKTMRLVPDTQPIHSVSDAIAAAKRVLGPGKGSDPGVWTKVKNTADKLTDVTSKRLEEIKTALENEIGKSRPEATFTTTSDQSELPLLSLLPIPYRPNTSIYQETRSLWILIEGYSFIVINFHAIGSKFRGLIGVVPAFYSPLGTHTGILSEPFQANYAESYESTERRFRPWLEQSLVNALTLWRKSL